MKKLAFLLLFICLFALATDAFKPSCSAASSWESKAPMQQARSRLGVAEVNGKVYAIGGDYAILEGNCIGPSIGTLLNTNEEYTPETNTWAFRKAMPTSRCCFATAVYQNKIYCIGGCVGYNNCTGANEVYDPATDTWETKAPMPTPRMQLQANVFDGKIYLIGGTTSYGLAYMAVNEVYDPVTDTWTAKSPSPNMLTSDASAVADGKIYFLSEASLLDLGAFIQIYNPNEDSWSIGGIAPTYGGISTTACATSGDSGSERIGFFDESSTFIYIPAIDKWEIGTAMPTHRGFPGVAFVNDVFYVVGGIPAPFEGYIVITQSTVATEQYFPNEHLPFNNADSKIYIRLDGSIEPSTANITTSDKVVYTFTGNNNQRLVIERDNIILDGKGFTLEGTEDFGISLFQRQNVIIKNVTIKDFQTAGIGMDNSSHNIILGNFLHDNFNDGIRSYGSSNNLISGNNISSNTYMSGIHLADGSNNNTISGNNIIGNNNNFIIENSNENHICHNNIVMRFSNFITGGSSNVWDNGYPSGGNNWNDYNGADSNGDGIGDTPYIIGANNIDNYPLMKPLALPETTPEPTLAPTLSPTPSSNPTPSQTTSPQTAEPLNSISTSPTSTTTPIAGNLQTYNNPDQTTDYYWIATAIAATTIAGVIATALMVKKKNKS